MKIIQKIEAWQQAADFNSNIYDQLQEESVAAVLGGKESTAWETHMRRFHSNAEQLQRLLGNDNLDPQYRDTILAYIGSGGACGGGTRLSLALNMPNVYKDALDSESLPADTRDDGSDPVSVP